MQRDVSKFLRVYTLAGLMITGWAILDSGSLTRFSSSALWVVCAFLVFVPFHAAYAFGAKVNEQGVRVFTLWGPLFIRWSDVTIAEIVSEQPSEVEDPQDPRLSLLWQLVRGFMPAPTFWSFLGLRVDSHSISLKIPLSSFLHPEDLLADIDTLIPETAQIWVPRGYIKALGSESPAYFPRTRSQRSSGSGAIWVIGPLIFATLMLGGWLFVVYGFSAPCTYPEIDRLLGSTHNCRPVPTPVVPRPTYPPFGSTPSTVTRILADNPPAFGPISGTFSYPGAAVEATYADVVVRNFIVEARVFNPDNWQDGWYDSGFGFRETLEGSGYRLYTTGSGAWFLQRRVLTDDVLHVATTQVSPGIADFSHIPGNSNLLRLEVGGGKGFLFVNGTGVAELQLADASQGRVSLFVGVQGEDRPVDEYTSKRERSWTRYEGFTVWLLP